MSSVAGYVATPFSGPYASSRHAIEGLSDALRRELKLLFSPIAGSIVYFCSPWGLEPNKTITEIRDIQGLKN